jgi:hypothetical protein
MSSTALPSPAPPTGESGRPRRRWPWLVAALSLALVLVTTGLVVVARDRSEARRELDALRKEIEAQQAPSGSDEGAAQPDQAGDAPSQGDAPPQGDAPSRGDAPSETPRDQGGLQDLLDQLMGSAGMPNVDPACFADAMGEGGRGESIEGTVEEQVAAIAPVVEDLRGLRFDEGVDPEFQPSDEFERELAETVESDYPDARADLDSRVLQLLGAIPEGTDLKALQSEVLEGQVAGYYDPDTGEIVVRVPDAGESLDLNGQVTLAHELDHALTDQALGLPGDDDEGQSDANLAETALVEGDATLLMQQFSFATASLMDQLGSALSPDALAAQDQLDDVPSYLRNQLMFPYLSGLGYACRLYVEGGWPAVDAAYDDLPRTTAEILFPEASGVAPEDPTDPASPGSRWTQARRDTLGAAPLLWLLQAPGGEEGTAIEGAEDAVRQWAGGELTLFTDGDKSALAVALVAKDDGDVLCDAVQEWYRAAFDTTSDESGGVTVLAGGGQVGALACDGRDVRLGIAPDEATAVALSR